jgi:hypothetical protein
MRTGLFLRQEVPVDKERISFNHLEEVDDMWIHLFYELHKKLGLEHSEVWMWGGGPRRIDYKNGFVEKWFHEFPINNFHPDFIFSRGGFKEYIPIMKHNPNAYKMYYGAIYKDRFNPKLNSDDTDYNLILADSQIQYASLNESKYSPFKFLKPCAENIFKPIKLDKDYDVVFIANAKQKKTKGHKWFFELMKKRNYKILLIGNLDVEVIRWCDGLDVDFVGWIPRKDIPSSACMAKAGVCCSIGDSSPRIIPEMLSMGIPVVIRGNEGLHIWEDVVMDKSCIISNSDKDFLVGLDLLIKNYKSFNPRKFYKENFRLDKISDGLVNRIKISSQTAPGLAT